VRLARVVSVSARPSPVSAASSVESPPAEPHSVHRGRLFRKYLILILTLVTSALLVSGAVSVYFSYQEHRAALSSLQQEKAVAAASRIEQYVRQIEQQLAYAALPQLDAGDVELRRIEFLKLLRQAPEITDVAQVDADGRERLAVSRLGMDVVGSGKDRSQEPAFKSAKRGQPWFGPVYFRKETEPYLTIAIRPGGDSGPVTIADVNLKFIWDVVTRIRIGDKGKAYVVDRNGFLVADPDIGLVLRKTDLSQLAHVKAAASPDPGAPATLSTNLAGTEVLTSVAPIGALGWNVFVEQPVAEVYAKLNASILRTALLLLAGLVISALAALALARGMARPIRTLEEGAQRIGAGDLDQRIDVHTGDELEALADQFNRMSAQLRESYAGLERKVDERTRELSETLEQQTAISEVLQVISRSPGDLSSMLKAVCERALTLCEAAQAVILLVDGDRLRFGAGFGGTLTMNKGEDMALTRGSVAGRAVIDRIAIHMPDLAIASPAEFPLGLEMQRRIGHHAILAVPLIREDRAIGALALWRMEARSFSEKQVVLVKTFADQATIAIENVRLFNETKEALEQQTAISEVLQVISKSPTDVQPVLTAVAERAAHLCDAPFARVLLVDGDQLRSMAEYSSADVPTPTVAVPLRPTSVTGRAVLARQTIHLHDVLPLIDTEYVDARENVLRLGMRSVLAVPLAREGGAYGAMILFRREPGLFSPNQVALVETFAQQAAIAIDNVRLFNETREALDQQRASGEVLRAISSSIADTKPVFDVILQSCQRLFAGDLVGMTLIREDGLLAIGAYGDQRDDALRRVFPPHPVDRETASGLAILDHRLLSYPDVDADDVPPASRAGIQALGMKSMAFAPMLFEGRGIGTLWVGRAAKGAFSDKQLTLLRTFAEQAVIAIQNARLFNETKEALEQQTAISEILRAISSSPTDVQPVLDAIAERAARLCDAAAASIYVTEGDTLHHLASKGTSAEPVTHIETMPIDRHSLSGRTLLDRRTIQVRDLQAEGAEFPTSHEIAGRLGHRSVVVAPLFREGKAFGTILLRRQEVRPFSEREVALLHTFGDQAVIALENVRLFREIQDKSRQLEIANKHKSEFLANMSHELRTPLNAIIGFSEVLLERLFGELNDKQDDYLKDIHSSGRHLLNLINDILDLSKVEAGRMELDLSTFDVANAIANATTLVRERAQRHGIALRHELDPGLGEIAADERKFKQILLNLLSNAVKFTPDGGHVDVRAHREPDRLVVAVHDTGIGIAPDDQQAVFEEFRQVGQDYTNKQEGTGLGLTLTRRFVELHGGTIRVDSEPGKGSTFTFTIPTTR
jgi:signal transduction histidine kinase